MIAVESVWSYIRRFKVVVLPYYCTQRHDQVIRMLFAVNHHHNLKEVTVFVVCSNFVLSPHIVNEK